MPIINGQFVTDGTAQRAALNGATINGVYTSASQVNNARTNGGAIGGGFMGTYQAKQTFGKK